MRLRNFYRTSTYSMVTPAVALGDVKFSVLESLPQKPGLYDPLCLCCGGPSVVVDKVLKLFHVHFPHLK